jgi:hypothetical protein
MVVAVFVNTLDKFDYFNYKTLCAIIQMGLLCNLKHINTSNICNEASRTHVTVIQICAQINNSLISKCAARPLVRDAQLNVASFLLFSTYCGMQCDAGRR